MNSQNLKRFFDHLEEVQQCIDGKKILLFLDYDGTLTPIVDKPDLAVISDEMRQAVQETAGKIKTSIVSGRATGDVRGKVKIDGIFYAGSHGFEIVDPDGNVTINDEARQVRPLIDQVHRELTERLKDVPGALVEHVKYTISTHYRLVSEEDFPRVAGAVEEILKRYPQLRKTSGKKVFEIRPKIDWDKGRAVAWILKVLGYDPAEHIPIYIGDDTTDEDAFRALKGKGFGILVSETPRPSEAEYIIKDTPEVKKVLTILISDQS